MNMHVRIFFQTRACEYTTNKILLSDDTQNYQDILYIFRLTEIE